LFPEDPVEQTNYAARLRYLDADAVDDAVVSYDGLDVQGPDGEKLGDLDGFIVDAEAGRVYYVVINTAGWFRTKQLLLPVGHATLESDRKALRVDVSKDALNRYPEFDDRRFREFTDEDLRKFEGRMVEACCPDDAATGSSEAWAYDSRRHYTQPEWWKSESRSGERFRPVEPRTAAPAASRVASPVARPVVTEHQDREQVIAREDDGVSRRSDPGDVSPHFAGRAQPGDVLGIETGGETTKVGDTPEDEDKRRRDAEKAAAEEDAPRRSER
jgi:hypothetical protein